MIDINSRTVSKLGILLILTTLAIGQAAAANIIDPASNSVLKPASSLDVNVTDAGSTFDIWYTNSTGDWKNLEDDTNSNSTLTAAGNFPTGSYQIKVNDTNSDDTITYYIDKSYATQDSVSPSDGAYVSKTDPEVSVTVQKNGEADLSYIHINLTDSISTRCTSFDSSSSTATCSFTPDLNAGTTYNVDWVAEDNLGNKNDVTDAWTFTVDTSYDGDTSPSWSEEGGDVMLQDDEEYDLELTFSDEDESDEIDVTCFDGSDDEIDSGTVDPSGGDSDSFTCQVEGEDYAGSSTDIYVEMCDQAGNCKTSSTYTFNFDQSAPNIYDLATVSGATVFNSNFDIEFEASDDASGVDEVEYYFEEDTELGDGTDIEYDSDTDSYTIDLSDLSSGDDHVLHVRAKDEVGRWGDASTIEFEYYPNEKPEVSLSVPESMEVIYGEEKSFDVTVENSGKLYIEEVEVSVSAADFYSDSENVSSLKSGDSETVSFDLNADDASLGTHDVTVSTESPSASKSFEVLVRASENQEENINQTYQDYLSKLEELKQNATELKPGLSQERKQRLEANLSDFESKVQNAEEAIANGKYYRAKSILSDIETDYSAAQQSYETVKEEQAAADQRRTYMIIGVVLLLGLGGLGAFFLASDEYDLNLDALTDSDIDIQRIEDIPARIKMMFKNAEEEAEEFEWDGFNN